jgi:hypothetical protein
VREKGRRDKGYARNKERGTRTRKGKGKKEQGKKRKSYTGILELDKK